MCPMLRALAFLKGLGSQIAERPGVALVGKQRGRMGDNS
jgi:hypothetical protein